MQAWDNNPRAVNELDDGETIVSFLHEALGDRALELQGRRRDLFDIDTIHALCLYFGLECPVWFIVKYGDRVKDNKTPVGLYYTR